MSVQIIVEILVIDMIVFFLKSIKKSFYNTNLIQNLYDKLIAW